MKVEPQEAHKIIGDYDRHYSTVRMGVTTFLVSFSAALATLILKDSKQWYVTFLGLVIPLFFLFLAAYLSIHFQRLTASCRKLQVLLEQDRLDVFARQVYYKQEVIKAWGALYKFLDYDRIIKLCTNATMEKVFEEVAWNKCDWATLDRTAVIKKLTGGADLSKLNHEATLFQHWDDLKKSVDRNATDLSTLIRDNKLDEDCLAEKFLFAQKIKYGYRNVYSQFEFRGLLEEMNRVLKLKRRWGYPDAPHKGLIFLFGAYAIAVVAVVIGKSIETDETCVVVERIVDLKNQITSETDALKGLAICGKAKKLESQ